MRFGLTTVGAFAMLSLAAACASGDDGSGVSAEALTAESDVDCTLESQPAYSGGAQIGTVDVVQIGGKRVALKTAHAFLELRRAAEAEGISITINSGFRTMSEQKHFYDCYKTGSCNNGNLAARPGYSNHQNGRALDIGGDRTRLNALIRRIGLDWRRTVPSEAWHYEYFGPWVDGPCGTASSQGAAPADTAPPDDVSVSTTAPPPEPPPPATTTQEAQDDENLDPYDPSDPYDPYRTPSTPPARTVPPSPQPSGEPQDGVGGDTSLGGEVITIDTPPAGSSAPPTQTPPPSAPKPTPVTAAPEPEASYSPQAATTPPTVKKKASKASPPIESGCAAAPGRAAHAPASILVVLAAAATARRRRRAAGSA